MLKIAQRQHIDTGKWNTITTVPEPKKFKFTYRSPVKKGEFHKNKKGPG